MQDIHKLFNLSEKFTFEDLRRSYNKKIDDISNSNISQFDKDYLIEMYNNYYMKGVRHMKNIEQYNKIQKYKKMMQRDNFNSPFNHNPFDFNIGSIYNPFKKFESDLFDDTEMEQNFIPTPNLTHQSINIPITEHKSIANTEYPQSENIEPNPHYKLKSMYRTHQSSIDKDGIETVYDSLENIQDGHKTTTTNAFKRYPDGHTEQIDSNKMLEEKKENREKK